MANGNGINKKVITTIIFVVIPVVVFFLQEWRHAEARGTALGVLKTTVQENKSDIDEIKIDINGIESALNENRKSWHKIETFMGRIDERLKNLEKDK